MKRYILKKRVFAVIFLIGVFGFAVINFLSGYASIRAYVTKKGMTVTAVDTAITENLYGRMSFVEIYAYMQTLLGKRESNNFSYIKDEEGFLHYASFYRDEDNEIFDYVMRVKRLQDAVSAHGTKVLLVVTPAKYDEAYTKFRIGMPVNDPGYIMDEMLLYSNRLGIETLDLREYIPNKELSYEEAFFKTDHHWTIPAAFKATQVVCDKIADSFGEELDPDNYYLNVDNYDVITYKSAMFGSMGRKTGVHFCDLEDFTAYWPKFTGNYSRKYLRENGMWTNVDGSFTETLMNAEVLLDTNDIYSESQYNLYLDGLTIYEQIINEDNPDGCSMFLIRDSYFSPVIAFLMPMCGQIDAVWSLEESDEIDVEEYLSKNTFDYIIVEVYPYNINENAFEFFEENEEINGQDNTK